MSEQDQAMTNPHVEHKAATSHPQPAIAESKQLAGKGRVLLCFLADGFTRYRDINDPRPGICVSSFPATHQNVNVFLDGGNDQEKLAEFRSRPEGNTLMSATIYDPLTPEQRAEVAKRHPYWCEWPPMPAPKSQPQPSGGQNGASLLALVQDVKTLRQGLLDLAALLRNAGGPTKNALNVVQTTLDSPACETPCNPS